MRKLVQPVIRISILLALACNIGMAQTFVNLVDFSGENGANPQFLALAQGTDGNYYGDTTAGGAFSQGTLFQLKSDGSLSTLYSFTGKGDGGVPHGTLLLDTDGNFYGTTEFGGTNNRGTIFKITLAGVLTTLHSFNDSDGNGPQDGLTPGSDGYLYGVTQLGGAYDGGTVFKISPEGVFVNLHSFNPASEGFGPLGALLQATDGNLYGTTQLGGRSNQGTLFRITHQGNLQTFHRFSGPDGAQPFSQLLQADDGLIYGTTNTGGAYNGGTVFRLSSKGKLTTMYSFCALTDCADGAFPIGALIQATDQNLYGTCANLSHGLYAHGSVFSLTPAGVLDTLHSFDIQDGADPHGGLLQATSGIFYGNTFVGGAHKLGTLFSLDTGLGPFVTLPINYGKVGQRRGILGQGFSATISVFFNSVPANFQVKSDTLLIATIPPGATKGVVTVVTSTGTLNSNKPFIVLQ